MCQAQGTEDRAHGSAQSYDKSVHCHLRAWPGTCLLPAWLPWYGRPRPTAYISTCQQTVSNIQKRSTQIDSFNGNLKANWQIFVYFKNPNYIFNTLLFYGRYFFMYHLFLTLIMFCTEVALTAPYPVFIFIAYSVRYKFCKSDIYHITAPYDDTGTFFNSNDEMWSFKIYILLCRIAQGTIFDILLSFKMRSCIKSWNLSLKLVWEPGWISHLTHFVKTVNFFSERILL